MGHSDSYDTEDAGISGVLLIPRWLGLRGSVRSPPPWRSKGQQGLEDRARETFHSTAGQAAAIARDAQVKRLIIGHFSARYKNLYPLLEEAKAVYASTTLAMEGDRFSIE